MRRILLPGAWKGTHPNPEERSPPPRDGQRGSTAERGQRRREREAWKAVSGVASAPTGNRFPEYLIGQLFDASLQPAGSLLGLGTATDFALQFTFQFANLQRDPDLRPQAGSRQARVTSYVPTGTVLCNRAKSSRKTQPLSLAVVKQGSLSGTPPRPQRGD